MMSAPRTAWLRRGSLALAAAVVAWVAWRAAGPGIAPVPSSVPARDPVDQIRPMSRAERSAESVSKAAPSPGVAEARTRTSADASSDSTPPVTIPSPTVSATAPVVTPTTPLREALSQVASIAAPDPAASGPVRPLIIPVAGVQASALHDMFEERRGGGRKHEAIDILAPRGTPVIATDEGSVKKLFTSVPGGLTVYQFAPDSRYCYYYAHLDSYANGLHEGQHLQRGEVVGYVGTTGNAPKDTPHLHFAIFLLDAERRWWKGTPINPYPLLTSNKR